MSLSKCCPRIVKLPASNTSLPPPTAALDAALEAAREVVADTRAWPRPRVVEGAVHQEDRKGKHSRTVGQTKKGRGGKDWIYDDGRRIKERSLGKGDEKETTGPKKKH